jgi:biotin transport system substrate-specific component
MEIITSYRQARYNFYRWRYESGFVYKLALAFMFAGLTGIGAQIRIPLPFTPVPITGQVFFVLLSGVVLGKYGGLSQGIYAGLGGAGIPWFNGMKGGWGVLTGVTGGYILGFILAASLIGWFVDNYTRSRTFSFQLSLMFLGVAVIYGLGSLQFSLVLGTGFNETLTKAVLPFIPGDIAKAVGVVLLATAILPKESYNGEVDFESTSHDRRRLYMAGFVFSGLLTCFFLLLFWAKIVSLGQANNLIVLKNSAWFSLSALITGLLSLHFLKLLR